MSANPNTIASQGTPTGLTKALPGEPAQENVAKAAGEKPILYILHYIQGRNLHFKFFTYASADMKKVVQRCRDHCDASGFKFLYVRPFMSNLEDDEKRHAEG